MKYLLYHLKIVIKIISSSFQYRKSSVLLCYLKLLAHSIAYHKLRLRTKTNDESFTQIILGFTVHFQSYSEIIYLFEEIFIHQVYKFTCSASKPYIVDCGSNIGLSILYFKTLYPNSRILAFEADSQTFKMLEENIQRNNLKNTTVLNLALSDVDGESFSYRNKTSFNSLNTSLIPMVDSDIEKVQTKKLSEFINEMVDMVKMDVEGSEAQILNDLVAKDRLHLIDQMIVEFHPNIISGSVDNYFTMLEKCGLTLHEIKKGTNAKSQDVVAHFNKIYCVTTDFQLY